MKESSHTPGPWTLIPDGANYGYTDTSRGVCEVGEDSWVIADVRGDYATHRMEANARLIAAAPDLLEALQDLLEIGKRDLSNLKYDGYFASARQAVDKALGTISATPPDTDGSPSH